MPNKILGFGNPLAKLCIIGEAPGRQEDEEGIPFVGPSGKLLAQALEEAGIDIGECYRTNVVKVRPPDNDLLRLPEIGYSILDFIPELYEEINLINPNCLLLVGDTALKYCTDYTGIMKYRGSILRSKLGIKAVPTIHPAALLGEAQLPWINFQYIKADIARAVEESFFPEYNIPQPTLRIAKSSLDVIRFRENYVHENRAVIDVETFKTYPLCVGIAFSKDEALSIPTFEDDIPDHDKAFIWREINDILSTNKLTAQNMKFDQKRVRQLGFCNFNAWMDISFGWHLLYSEMPKKLSLISSLLTKVPYYKDDGREYNPKKDNIEKLFIYNARDCTTEFECMEVILKELEENNLLDFFFDRIMPLHKLYSDIEDVGILIDKVVRTSLTKKYQDLRAERKQILLSKIKTQGVDEFRILRKRKGVNTPVGIKVEDFNCDSPSQVGAMVFGYLGCPQRKDSGEETLKALINNSVKSEVKKEIITGILEDRKIGKTINTYLLANLSTYGRLHTQYNVNGTKTGRTSTSALEAPVTIYPEGIALQTMTKHEDTTLSAGGADLRSMFISDKGWTFIEADLSSAEDWCVAVLACDKDALEQLGKKNFVYNQHKLKDDRHTLTAILVCEKKFEDITDFDRQIGKRVRHAGNYDMGKHRGMETFAKFGIFMSEWKVGKLLEKFHFSNPRIRSVFHADIKEALANNENTLINPYGRREIFFDKGEEIFKQAFAFIPQSTVSDSVKFSMLNINKRLDKSFFHFVGESHDSCLALVKDDKINFVAKVIKEEMETPINFRKCTLSRNIEISIPCEVQVGKRWISKNVEFTDGMERYKNG